ncbi:metallophosphoesterase family protein [Eubacterium pyruvativorans]|uniref:metallophosphoesterase family protein n=1 Tax=Eubacterium pyruvativorans TaxID=155865 RepID=UPI0023F42F08|nr:metallophosphoesterase [Eubacterium pyruvativorans]MDD7684298.1 metallophosphoesterase [Eubacterium pyruvativorans]
MKLLVVSDTHGKTEKVRDVYEKISARDSIDALIHCGDYKRDAEELARVLDIPVYGIPGNCDGGFRAEFLTVPTPAGNILVTHGHGEHVDYGLEELNQLALSLDCRCACFGHTHVPVQETSAEGILMVNPGSLTRPRDGSSDGSCAVLYAEPEGITASILHYDSIMNEPGSTSGGSRPPKKKARGGFLRKIMNYSDGQ